MGLRISRSIVESHGGRLWAAENSPRGARFYLTLSVKAEGHDDTRSRPTPIKNGIRPYIPKHDARLLVRCYLPIMVTQENTKLVAIVDDDDLMRSALQGLLKAVGLPARAFASAEEFLKSGQQHETAWSDRGHPYARNVRSGLQAS